ncbi:hypothetical protein ACQKWADRAFT_131610 [Trichoderma austrokoningii]
MCSVPSTTASAPPTGTQWWSRPQKSPASHFPGSNLHVPATCPAPDISSRPSISRSSLANLLRVSQAAPPSSTSPCRELCLLFFFHFSLSLFSAAAAFPPFSISWGSRSLFYLCLVARIFASPPRKRLLFDTAKKPPSIHPSRLAPRPGLASPAFTAHRPPSCRYYWTDISHSQSLVSSRLVCLLLAIHSPAAFLVSLRASSASITDNIPLLSFLTHTQSKNPGSSPVIYSSSYRLFFFSFFLSSSAARRPPCSVNRHI